MQLENIQAIDWLHKRGITDKVITFFSLSVKDVPFLHLESAIVIPVCTVDGEFAFNKYRRSPLEGDVKPKYLYDRGGKVTLYGADKLVAHNHTGAVIITEGELDTLVCWSKGIPAVSSTGGAMSFQPEWAELLARYDVYVCFDNDEAGHKGVIRVLECLPEAKVMFVPTHIAGVKDISDYVAHGGDLHALMQTARPYRSMEDVVAHKEELRAMWADYSFHLLYLAHHTVVAHPSPRSTAVSPHSTDRLQRAKAVDCTTLHDFGQGGKGKCLWHDDSDPSLQFYPKKNNCYCFPCGKYADGIDIVMMKQNVGIKEAIKLLLGEPVV